MYSEKFKNLVLYVLSNDDYIDGGIKKLNKILYFIDFYYYREYEKFISDVKYAKADMGPLVNEYKKVFSQMYKDGVLDIHDCEGTYYHKPKIKPDLNLFNSEEIDHIRNILEKYGKLSSSELENISHQQQPWVLTKKMGEIIDPDLALLIDDGSTDEIEVKDDKLIKELEDIANSLDE